MKTILSLLGTLKKATENDKLSWTIEGKWGFASVLPDGHKIVVWEWADGNTGTPGVSVSLEDKEGTTIDQSMADEFNPKYADLRDLLQAAKRSAHDVNSVIESLEKVLLRL